MTGYNLSRQQKLTLPHLTKADLKTLLFLLYSLPALKRVSNDSDMFTLVRNITVNGTCHYSPPLLTHKKITSICPAIRDRQAPCMLRVVYTLKSSH